MSGLTSIIKQAHRKAHIHTKPPGKTEENEGQKRPVRRLVNAPVRS